jgi:hypothetical protein
VRYIAYGLAIFAALVGIAFTTGTLPRDAIASHNEANGTMNAVHLEQAIYRGQLSTCLLPIEWGGEGPPAPVCGASVSATQK